MEWGIKFKPTGGPFSGAWIPLMSYYGFPDLYPNRMAAILKGNEVVNGSFLPLPCTEKEADILIRGIVEYFSGRQKIVGEAFVLADATRPDYDYLLPHLVNEKERLIQLNGPNYF